MLGGISIWQLLIGLAILILIFGTKKLKNLGSDLGGAVKSFKETENKEAIDKEAVDKEEEKTAQHKVIDAEVKKDDKSA